MISWIGENFEDIKLEWKRYKRKRQIFYSPSFCRRHPPDKYQLTEIRRSVNKIQNSFRKSRSCNEHGRNKGHASRKHPDNPQRKYYRDSMEIRLFEPCD